jgi:hypothetical protein
MNYGGTDFPPPSKKWHPWRAKFLWTPMKIDGKWYWLRNVHERFRMVSWATSSSEEMFEYQYAVNVFDLMQKDAA